MILSAKTREQISAVGAGLEHPPRQDTLTFFEGSALNYGNYLDEVWVIDDRVGVSVGDLNDGTGSDRHFYHQNELWHVYALTDETGALAEAHQFYDPYGKTTIITGPGTDTTWFTSDDVTTTVSAIGNPFNYWGLRFDPETRLINMRNRFYSVDLGRFLQRDPMGGAMHGSLYSYEGSDPMGLGAFDIPTDTPVNILPAIPGLWCEAQFKHAIRKYGRIPPSNKPERAVLDWCCKIPRIQKLYPLCGGCGGPGAGAGPFIGAGGGGGAGVGPGGGPGAGPGGGPGVGPGGGVVGGFGLRRYFFNLMDRARRAREGAPEDGSIDIGNEADIIAVMNTAPPRPDPKIRVELELERLDAELVTWMGATAYAVALTGAGAYEISGPMLVQGLNSTFVASAANVLNLRWRGGEFVHASGNFRISFFGHHGGWTGRYNPAGGWQPRLPHYHRRGPLDPRTGGTVPGQGIGRHRPWQGGF